MDRARKMTSNADHYRKLEQMYHQANINEIFAPKITISEGKAEITMEVLPKFFHAAGALHGSVYFKMLDDVAYFAASSLLTDTFALTTQFNLHFLKPVSHGTITAIGQLVNATKSSYISESKLYNEKGDLIAIGTGTFVKSRIELSFLESYKERL
ncbi:MAG: hypothetical protein K940chlam3_00917 [Chlamydiae bacterium]|nr:hypothetical protein [Chlamydiota bacterium]